MKILFFLFNQLSCEIKIIDEIAKSIDLKYAWLFVNDNVLGPKLEIVLMAMFYKRVKTAVNCLSSLNSYTQISTVCSQDIHRPAPGAARQGAAYRLQQRLTLRAYAGAGRPRQQGDALAGALLPAGAGSEGSPLKAALTK